MSAHGSGTLDATLGGGGDIALLAPALRARGVQPSTVHDSIFDVPARPMFRWGRSPFRMRGVVYRDSVARAERLLAARGTSVVDVLRAHGDPGLESFVTQRFSPIDWYDVYPSIHFAPLVAKACGVTLAQHTRESALLHAEWARQGFTSVILKLLSTETVATWLPRVSGWYHDYGAITSRVVGEGHVRGVRTGLPIFVVQGWTVIAMEFVEHVLAHAGAKAPRAHGLDVEPDGELHGCPLYRVHFEIRWSV
jgi:hypothetical protein